MRTYLLLALIGTGCAATGPLVQQPVRDLPRDAVTRAETMLKQHPGVRLVHGRLGPEVRIRGARHEPLYVVDGLPLFSEPGRTLLALDPHDIADIHVLTDPVDLAFYGLRGGGGVVVITTKRPG